MRRSPFLAAWLVLFVFMFIGAVVVKLMFSVYALYIWVMVNSVLVAAMPDIEKFLRKRLKSR